MLKTQTRAKSTD